MCVFTRFFGHNSELSIFSIKIFSSARSYQSLVTDIKSFSRSGVGGLRTSSKVRILVFLAVFHSVRRGTRSKTILMIFFGNTTLMYLLSRGIVDFCHVIMRFRYLTKCR